MTFCILFNFLSIWRQSLEVWGRPLVISWFNNAEVIGSLRSCLTWIQWDLTLVRSLWRVLLRNIIIIGEKQISNECSTVYFYFYFVEYFDNADFFGQIAIYRFCKKWNSPEERCLYIFSSNQIPKLLKKKLVVVV